MGVKTDTLIGGKTLFTFKEVTFKDILNIPSLEIPDTKVTTLFGESGSGKSTLMKLLNQLISQDEGEIYYKDQLITDYDPVELRRDVVMLAQQPAMFEGTVKDNLLVGLRFSGKKDASDAELKDALSKVQLKKELDEDAGPLSGGEKQRLAFARVILMEPNVFLIDEPTSALDENTENLVMDAFIDHIRDTGKTVVMVTHSKAVAEKYSDNVVYMSEINQAGRVTAHD